LSRSAEKPVTRFVDPDAIGPLKPGDFEQIRRMAYQESGLDLKAGKEELVTARLRSIVHSGGFRTFQEYYKYVAADTTGRSLAGMIDALVTNHTAFYREPDHFEFLRQHVFPLLARRDPLEIWSAACSTGEEVWTLAFLLNDAFPGRRIQIAASDISNRALRLAHRAVYPAERCQGMPNGWLGRYFAVEPGPPKTYRVSEALRAQATFQRLNLIAPGSNRRLYPVIFCRNVMIYFDGGTQEKVVRFLSECLEPGGFLFVGHAESLTRVSHNLEYVRPAVYRKPEMKGVGWSRSS
jgi:chemotaxis protein methyltransferase CheR